MKIRHPMTLHHVVTHVVHRRSCEVSNADQLTYYEQTFFHLYVFTCILNYTHVYIRTNMFICIYVHVKTIMYIYTDARGVRYLM